MKTPEQLGLELPHIRIPKDGFKEGVYLVNVAWEPTNIIHRAVMWISQLNEEPDPDSSFAKQFPKSHRTEMHNWKTFRGINNIHNWIHGGYENAYNLVAHTPVFIDVLMYIDDALHVDWAPYD